MEKCRSHVFLLILTIFYPHFFLQSHALSEYSRHPPRKIIFTPHHRSNSDPQQVSFSRAWFYLFVIIILCSCIINYTFFYMQVHISLVGTDHMRVSWITDDKSVPSIVEYGKISGRYDSSATGEHTSYQYFFYNSGKIHHVKIGPLDAATTYYYKCGGYGPEFLFRTPPSTFPLEFAVVGKYIVSMRSSPLQTFYISIFTLNLIKFSKFPWNYIS